MVDLVGERSGGVCDQPMIVVPLDFVLHTFGFLGKSDEVATQILSKQATSLLRFAADAGGLQIIKIQKGVFIEDEENPAEESSSAEIICAFEADSCCVTDPGTAGNMLLKVVLQSDHAASKLMFPHTKYLVRQVQNTQA